MGMRKKSLLFGSVHAVALVFLWAFLVPCGVFAEPADAAATQKIAVIKMDKVFGDYEKTKAADAQLEKLSSAKQSQREQMASEIKNMREELPLLNDQARLERQKAIEEKFKSLTEFDRDAKESLRKERDEAVKGILDEIEAAVASYATDHGITLVITDRAVVYSPQTIDISNEILKILNDHTPRKKS